MAELQGIDARYGYHSTTPCSSMSQWAANIIRSSRSEAIVKADENPTYDEAHRRLRAAVVVNWPTLAQHGLVFRMKRRRKVEGWLRWRDVDEIVSVIGPIETLIADPLQPDRRQATHIYVDAEGTVLQDVGTLSPILMDILTVAPPPRALVRFAERIDWAAASGRWEP